MCLFPSIPEPDVAALTPAKSPPPAPTPEALFRPGEGGLTADERASAGGMFQSVLTRLRLPVVPGLSNGPQGPPGGNQ